MEPIMAVFCPISSTYHGWVPRLGYDPNCPHITQIAYLSKKEDNQVSDWSVDQIVLGLFNLGEAGFPRRDKGSRLGLPLIPKPHDAALYTAGGRNRIISLGPVICMTEGISSILFSYLYERLIIPEELEKAVVKEELHYLPSFSDLPERKNFIYFVLLNTNA
eukprot:Gb_22586 [translate_table: standard]